MFLRSIVSVSIGLVLCVILTGLAATIASARPSMTRLDADFASSLHANYSRDPQSVRFAPIHAEIIEAAKDDREHVAPPMPDGPSVAPDDTGVTPASSGETPDGPAETEAIEDAGPRRIRAHLPRRSDAWSISDSVAGARPLGDDSDARTDSDADTAAGDHRATARAH